MNVFTLNVVALMAACVLSTAAAQSIYKCGDSYSQMPCPGAVLVDASDQRTSAQKTQADATSKRNAQTANAMEKARLQQEKTDLANNTLPVKKIGNTSADKTQSTGVKKKKKKESEYFSAQVAGEKKNKKNQKKIPEKKDSSQS